MKVHILLVLCLLPFASGLTLHASPIPNVDVAQAGVNGTLIVEEDCQDLLLSAPGTTRFEYAISIQVTDAFIHATGPSNVQINCDNPLSTQYVEIPFMFQASLDASANQPSSVEYRVLGETGNEGVISTPITVNPFFATSIHSSQRVQPATSQVTLFEVEISNMGNSRIQYKFSADNVTSTRIGVMVPEPIVLDPQESRSIPFEVTSTRGLTGAHESFSLTVQPEDTQTQEIGPQVSYKYEVEVKPNPVSAAFLFIGIIAFLVAAAFGFRRYQNKEEP